ncbi:MAG: 1-deoxy-D-xylulose-5-phosphate synthase [Proteobacteria bacterium]|nr:1-deoxy-D-xylulose-5-phosphate synthase [Pseudomonadota bacterium]
MTYLDKINSPADIKNFKLPELEALSDEIRAAILNRDSKIGGHVGPNLGIVETTVALHYVFDSPRDKIVYDVSHQCYPHKILTGRKDGFINGEKFSEISGYTNPAESEHDFFIVGHTSTSVSLACGLAKARDLKNEKNNIIALIGDGSLSGGEALEGLSNAAVLNSNIIIIVNDNEMSIAENHGGIYANLHLLRQTGGKAECNMFKVLGFDYLYVEEGNSVARMVETLSQVKDTPRPTVVHIHTQKGKGWQPAEDNREKWHWNLPFDIKTGENTVTFDNSENYNDITFNYLNNRLKSDKDIVVISAGTPGAFGFTPEKRRQLGQNYVDVGIAEEHAVAFSSALAKGGCKPVFCVWSSFVQRTYDQLSQDLAINNNPAVILVFSGGISGMDATHLGCFDIPLISNIPNIVYLAPATKQEYLSMLEWGLEQTKHPVVIRVPATVISASEKVDTNYDKLNTSQIVRQGSEVAILALGSFFSLGQQVADSLRLHGIEATLVNPRYITGLDEQLLNRLKQDHRIVVTLEDGVLDGGFGEKVARFYGTDDIKVLNRGARKEFTDRVPLEQLYRRYRLTPEQITADILALR